MTFDLLVEGCYFPCNTCLGTSKSVSATKTYRQVRKGICCSKQEERRISFLLLSSWGARSEEKAISLAQVSSGWYWTRLVRYISCTWISLLKRKTRILFSWEVPEKNANNLLGLGWVGGGWGWESVICLKMLVGLKTGPFLYSEQASIEQSVIRNISKREEKFHK